MPLARPPLETPCQAVPPPTSCQPNTKTNRKRLHFNRPICLRPRRRMPVPLKKRNAKIQNASHMVVSRISTEQSIGINMYASGLDASSSPDLLFAPPNTTRHRQAHHGPVEVQTAAGDGTPTGSPGICDIIATRPGRDPRRGVIPRAVRVVLGRGVWILVVC